jgi:hypothetical protein
VGIIDISRKEKRPRNQTSPRSRSGFLLTGGVDVPLSPQFTATAGVNVGFIDDTEVGLLLGVGYNF